MERGLQVLTVEEQIAQLTADVDAFWLLFGSVLVFFMQTGRHPSNNLRIRIQFPLNSAAISSTCLSWNSDLLFALF